MNFSKNINANYTQTTFSNENIKTIINIFKFIDDNLTIKDINIYTAEFIRLSKSNIIKSLNIYSDLGSKFADLFKFIIRNTKLLTNLQYFSKLNNSILKIESLVYKYIDEITNKEVLSDLSLIMTILESHIQEKIDYFEKKDFYINNFNEYSITNKLINLADDYISYIYAENGNKYTKDFCYEYFDNSNICDFTTKKVAFKYLCMSAADILSDFKTKESYENLDSDSEDFIFCLRSLLKYSKMPDLIKRLPKFFNEVYYKLYLYDLNTSIELLNKYLSQRFKEDHINDELCCNSNDLMKIKIFFNKLNN